MQMEGGGRSVCEYAPFDRKQVFFVSLHLKFILCPWAAPKDYTD